jgi:hypothetical protein
MSGSTNVYPAGRYVPRVRLPPSPLRGFGGQESRTPRTNGRTTTDAKKRL